MDHVTGNVAGNVSSFYGKSRLPVNVFFDPAQNDWFTVSQSADVKPVGTGNVASDPKATEDPDD
jgi:hypothetical protein